MFQLELSKFQDHMKHNYESQIVSIVFAVIK